MRASRDLPPSKSDENDRSELPSGTFEFDEKPAGLRASFILRCWTADSGEFLSSLMDVRTRATYPLSDVDELPELIRDLMLK